ncbi:MAG TPA: benzoate/H(+) symporter BenE family transporter [Solirubrobacteraceae bacterium]|jgi:benzoate membrane transport protein|nr:benzoate/H(+) symporter BenE family transporter [Solirubrobacteraceae bacterium]
MQQAVITRPGFRQAASTHSILAGIVAALVGWTAASAVVLSGLHRVGATPVEAASGLLAVTATMGLGTILISFRHRMPIMLAWSTPGAALLASTGIVHGGWSAAVGGFLMCGVLILLTGLWPRLGALIASIPTPIAQAMLAGIVLELCLTPVRGFVAHPSEVGPIVLVWLAMRRLAPKWAAPAAFGAALIVVSIVAADQGGVHGSLLPHLIWTSPQFTSAGVLSIALPLYVVTMAGQNVPGTAVLASYDYEVPWRESMGVTGVGTLIGACIGGHAINLAAISASLVAAPAADPDPQTRWTAAVAAGAMSLVLSLFAGALATLISVASPDVIGSVAGLALLATLAASLAAALSVEGEREAAAITFVIAASGATFLSVGSAFWALLAGLAVRVVTRVR